MTTSSCPTAPAFLTRRPSLNLFFNKPILTPSTRPQPLFRIPASTSSSSAHVARVTTAPIEYAPPAPDFDLTLQIQRLKTLNSALSANPSLDHKIRIIDRDPTVKQFFLTHTGLLSRIFASLALSKYDLYLFKCVVAAGQGHVFASGVFEVVHSSELPSARGSLKSALYALVDIIEKWDGNGMSNVGSGTSKIDVLLLEREQVKALRELLKTLANVEKFYSCIGGIIGYGSFILSLLILFYIYRSHPHWVDSG